METCHKYHNLSIIFDIIILYIQRNWNKKEKNILKIIFATLNGEKAKVKAVGKTLNLLTLLVVISKCLAERISREKGVSLDEAEDIVVDCIKDSMKTVKE